MSNLKIVLKFTLLFTVIYIFLLLPQTKIDLKYEKFFRSIGAVLFEHFGEEGIVFFKEEHGKGFDTKLFLSKKSMREKNGDYQSTIFPINARRIGWISTAFFISLVFATPVQWKRKIIAMLAGFILVTAYAMIKLRILILHFYTLSKTIGLYRDPEQVKRIEFWSEFFARPNTPVYYFVIIVWLAVCFNKNDWMRLHGALKLKPENKKPFANAIADRKRKFKKTKQ